MANIGFSLLNLLTGLGQGYVGQKEALRREGLEDERTLSERSFRKGLFEQEKQFQTERDINEQKFRSGEREAGERASKAEREAKEKSDAADREDRQAHERDIAGREIAVRNQANEVDRIRAQADLLRAQTAEGSTFNPHKMIAEATTDYMIKLATQGLYTPQEVNAFGQQFSNNLLNMFKSQGALPYGPELPPGGIGEGAPGTGDAAVDEALRLERTLRIGNVGQYREPDSMQGASWRNLSPDTTQVLRTLR